MLDAQAWRAARLVVDTGLHALRWPRQRSIDFLLEAGLSETDATIETDRYIAWPGQALTYKIGQREIERLRGELDRARRLAFDLRGFHDRCSATARCRWRRSRASCRTGWRPRLTLRGDRSLRVEADPERVERPEQDAPAALVPVRPVELAADRVDRQRPERLGRERERAAPDEAEPEPVRVRAGG